MLLAHVAGLPAEEMLAAGPALLAGGGLFAARVRHWLRGRRDPGAGGIL